MSIPINSTKFDTVTKRVDINLQKEKAAKAGSQGRVGATTPTNKS